MTDPVSEKVEYVAALELPNHAISNLDVVLSRLTVAVEEAIADSPAVTAYFVQHMSGSNEIHVGLRFEDVKSDLVEDWADEIMRDTFVIFRRGGGLGAAANLRREDSTLVVA